MNKLTKLGRTLYKNTNLYPELIDLVEQYVPKHDFKKWIRTVGASKSQGARLDYDECAPIVFCGGVVIYNASPYNPDVDVRMSDGKNDVLLSGEPHKFDGRYLQCGSAVYDTCHKFEDVGDALVSFRANAKDPNEFKLGPEWKPEVEWPPWDCSMDKKIYNIGRRKLNGRHLGTFPDGTSIIRTGSYGVPKFHYIKDNEVISEFIFYKRAANLRGRDVTYRLVPHNTLYICDNYWCDAWYYSYLW